MAERSSELTSGTELPVPCCRPRGPAGPGCAGARDRRRADASGPRSRSAQPGADHSPEQGAEMGEHAAALEAACTAISDLAAALADVRAAALDGDGVQAEPAGNGWDRLAVGAGRHRGGPTGNRSGRARIWRCRRERAGPGESAGPGARRRPGRGRCRAAISSTGPAGAGWAATALPGAWSRRAVLDTGRGSRPSGLRQTGAARRPRRALVLVGALRHPPRDPARISGHRRG